MEDQWIRQAQAGDQEAFRLLVERYARLTERTARILTANPALAEEAVQEAWLDAWRGLSRFEVSRPFRPWLLTLVANRCRMSARRQKLVSVPLDSPLATHLPGLDIFDPAVSSLQQAEDAELRARLGELRPDQQQVLALRYWADLELSEIARLLDVPLGTVKSRLHRSLRELRDRLETSHTDPETRPSRQGV